MPTWVKVATDAWTSAAGVADGYVFRPVNRARQAQGLGLSEKVVWQLLQPYALATGVPGIAPHDCRRTCAKLYRAAGGELEQIQLLLGHASVQTTERYRKVRYQPRLFAVAKSPTGPEFRHPVARVRRPSPARSNRSAARPNRAAIYR